MVHPLLIELHQFHPNFELNSYIVEMSEAPGIYSDLLAGQGFQEKSSKTLFIFQLRIRHQEPCLSFMFNLNCYKVLYG
jgi:hypothetical protein